MPFGLLALLMLASCTPSYIRRAPTLGPDERMPALLLHASVNEQSEDATQTVGHVTTDMLIQDREIEGFGKTVVRELRPVLEAHGIDLVLAPERAALAENIDWSNTWSVRIAPFWSSLTKVSTAWVDERGAYIGGLHADHLFRRSGFARIAARLNTDEATDGSMDGYLFITVRVVNSTQLLIIQAPQIRVNVFVTDPDGQEIFRAQGFGNGRSRFLAVDRSRENLSRALERAIQAMQSRPHRTLGNRSQATGKSSP